MWKKTTLKIIIKLVPGKQYLLAYRRGFPTGPKFSYRTATWHKWDGEIGHFHDDAALSLPEYISEIKEPK